VRGFGEQEYFLGYLDYPRCPSLISLGCALIKNFDLRYIGMYRVVSHVSGSQAQGSVP
jgi:hypothetical protein